MVLIPEGIEVWLSVVGSVWSSIVSSLLTSIGANITVPVISRADLSDVTSVFPLVDESVVIGDIIIDIVLIFELFVIGSISISKFVAINISVSHLHLSHMHLILSLEELDFSHVLDLSEAEWWS